jgi:murein DD-endopeptidase MepM/ murein hydrolase activator NlpD
MPTMTMPRVSSTLALALLLACGTDGGVRETTAWDESTADSTTGESTTSSAAAESATGPSMSTDGLDDAESDGAPLPDLPAVDDCPRVRVMVPPDEPLNVRPDPSTANPPIGSLQNGTIVTVIDEVQGEAVEGNTLWFHIEYLDTSGYVSGVFAACTLDEPPEPPDGYYLPLPCGMQSSITQGNMGATSHTGLHAYAFDLGIPLDTPLVAMADGTVSLTYAETMPGDPCYGGGGPECSPFGNLVILLHGDGTATLYKHLNQVQVSVGDVVPRGQSVGLSGSTGYSTGRHAHVMRMENCGQLTCQSIPLEWVDAGVPVTGDAVVSQNCP